MNIVVRSRRKKRENILVEFPDAKIIDVTSKGPEPWVKFSPFYPHYDIPVPLWDGKKVTCVEAIWQALKVFESTDVDESMLANDTMKNIKRTVRRFGRVLGHRRMDTGELLPYVEARKLIYLPAYRFVLENKLQNCSHFETWQLAGPLCCLTTRPTKTSTTLESRCHTLGSSSDTWTVSGRRTRPD